MEHPGTPPRATRASASRPPRSPPTPEATRRIVSSMPPPIPQLPLTLAIAGRVAAACKGHPRPARRRATVRRHPPRATNGLRSCRDRRYPTRGLGREKATVRVHLTNPSARNEPRCAHSPFRGRGRRPAPHLAQVYQVRRLRLQCHDRHQGWLSEHRGRPMEQKHVDGCLLGPARG